MSKYYELLKELESTKCPTCHGGGECDDAEPGDIFCRTWVCPDCHGTGLKFAVSLDIDYSAGGVISLIK